MPASLGALGLLSSSSFVDESLADGMSRSTREKKKRRRLIACKFRNVVLHRAGTTQSVPR